MAAKVEMKITIIASKAAIQGGFAGELFLTSNVAINVGMVADNPISPITTGIQGLLSRK